MFGDLRYANKDIISIREDIMEYVKTHDPKWTDFNQSSLQLQYVDIVSGVVDLMCYYLDNQALETYLSSARQEKNVKNILHTLNYDIPPMGSARGSVKITRRISEQSDDGEVIYFTSGRVKIPKYTKIYSEDETIPSYLTYEEAYMPNEKNQIEVPVIQGELRQMFISNATIAESYKLYITDTPVPLEYVEIISEGWEKVPDAFLEIKGGKKYSVHVDTKDRVYILFTCDWKNYLIDMYNGGLTVQYVESLGSSGKVTAGSLNKIGVGPIDIDTKEDMSRGVTVSNDAPTYGAFDHPSINEQKANGQLWLQTYDRLITLQDFEVLLKKYPWIKDCYCCDWRTNGRLVVYPHQAKAWVMTRDGADITDSTQLGVIQNEIQEKTVMMTTVEVLPAELLTTNWRIGISLVGASATVKARIRERVETRLKSWFLLDEYCKDNEESRLSFGMEIKASVFEADIIRMSDAIDNVVMPFEEDIKCAENQFLNVQSIEVYIVE